jgi:hypothetical protein
MQANVQIANFKRPWIAIRNSYINCIGGERERAEARDLSRDEFEIQTKQNDTFKTGVRIKRKQKPKLQKKWW